jgi:Na+/melibiose symporter-like transporter
MPEEMTDDYDERTRLMTWRVAILALAILLSGGLSPAIRDGLGPDSGYRAVGLFVGILIAAGALGAWWGTRNAPERREVASTAPLREQLRTVSAAKDFRVLLLTFVIQALGLGAMLAGVDYMARVVIGDRSASTILFVCFVAPALVVTPFWQRVGERVGKKVGYLASSGLLLLGMLLTYLLREAPMVPIALAVAIVGVGYAGAQMFPMAMLPDCAAADAAATGENRIGLYTGVWTAGETLGLALGPGLYALILAFGGYASSTTGDAEQSSAATQAIALGFGVVPAILVLISFGPLLAYRLTDRFVAEAAAAAGLPEDEDHE